MRNKVRFLIGCAILTGCGAVLSAAGIASGGIVNGIQIDSKGLRVYSPRFEAEKEGWYTKEGEKTEAFDSIAVNLDYADIRIETSKTNEYTVSCSLQGSDFQYEVTDGRLVFGKRHERHLVYNTDFTWFSWGSSINAKEEYVTIGIPEGAKLSSVDIQSDSGNVACDRIQADSLKLSADYGDVNLTDVSAQKIEAELESGNFQMEQVSGGSCKVKDEYGNISLYDVKLSEDMQISVESGDVRFRNAVLRDLVLDSAYGKVNGQQTQFRSLELSADSGDCEFTDALLDNCSIESEYGNVDISLVKPVTDYGYELETGFGSITIDDKKMGTAYATLEDYRNRIEIRCDSGDIHIQ